MILKINLLKALRKSGYSLISAGIMLVSSCSQYGVQENITKGLTEKELENIHTKVKLHYNNSSVKEGLVDDTVKSTFVSEFDKNFEIAQNKGVEYLMKVNGLNPSLPETVSWAMDNLNNSKFYEDLLMKISFETEEDANVFFHYLQVSIEFDSILGKSMILSREKNDDSNKGDKSGCVRAIVGTVLTTLILGGVSAGSGGVATPAAIGFLIAKGWNTYNVMSACKGKEKK